MSDPTPPRHHQYGQAFPSAIPAPQAKKPWWKVTLVGTPTSGEAAGVAGTTVVATMPTVAVDGDVLVLWVSCQVATPLGAPADRTATGSSTTAAEDFTYFCRVAAWEGASYSAATPSPHLVGHGGPRGPGDGTPSTSPPRPPPSARRRSSFLSSLRHDRSVDHHVHRLQPDRDRSDDPNLNRLHGRELPRVHRRVPPGSTPLARRPSAPRGRLERSPSAGLPRSSATRPRSAPPPTAATSNLVHAPTDRPGRRRLRIHHLKGDS